MEYFRTSRFEKKEKKKNRSVYEGKLLDFVCYISRFQGSYYSLSVVPNMIWSWFYLWKSFFMSEGIYWCGNVETQDVEICKNPKMSHFNDTLTNIAIVPESFHKNPFYLEVECRIQNIWVPPESYFWIFWSWKCIFYLVPWRWPYTRQC